MRVLSSFLLACFGVIGWAVAAPAAQSSDREAVHKVRMEWLRAYGESDIPTLTRLVLPDAVIVESTGALRDRAAIISRARDPIPVALSIVDERIDIVGNVARAVGRVAERRGEELLEFRVTDQFVRRNGRWRLSASHWTRTYGELTPKLISPAALDRMAGNYRNPKGSILKLRRDGNDLVLTDPAGQTARFVAVSERMIVGPDKFARWLFVADAQGRITNAVVLNRVFTTTLLRVD